MPHSRFKLGSISGQVKGLEKNYWVQNMQGQNKISGSINFGLKNFWVQKISRCQTFGQISPG